MPNHKALVIKAIGGAPVFIERPTPEPKEDEVLLKVSIVGLNPHDGLARAAGLFIENTLPATLGIDLVGTVVKLGHGVSKFTVGDEVMAFGNPFNPDACGTQEYCVVPAYQATLIPSGISADEAATFPLNTMTMVFALFHHTGLGLYAPFGDEKDKSDYRSDSILIIGGGSATGKFGIELARLANFGNIITVASKSNEQLLKGLGATAVIDRTLSEEEIERQIRDIVGDNLVYAIDCVGSSPDGQTLGARALSNSKRGTLVVLVHKGGVDDSRIGPKVEGYERRAILCVTTEYPDITTDFWNVLPQWIEEGKVRPTTFQVVDGLDADKIDGFLDAYVSGGRVLKPHVHLK